MFTKYVSMLIVCVVLFFAFLLFFLRKTLLKSRLPYMIWVKTYTGDSPWKKMLINDVISKSSNPCVSQVNQKPFLLTSAEIEILLCQSCSFSVLTCKGSRLSLDPEIWHGSYFYLEILVCKFWQGWKMDHLPVLRSLMREHFNLKMFLPKLFPLGKSFITMSKVVLGLQKKVVQRGISRVG